MKTKYLTLRVRQESHEEWEAAATDIAIRFQDEPEFWPQLEHSMRKRTSLPTYLVELQDDRFGRAWRLDSSETIPS
jgi:hypothetical protein